MMKYPSSLLNKKVLSLILKVSTDVALRTSRGGLFHSAGAQDEKKRDPALVIPNSEHWSRKSQVVIS